MTSNNKNNDLSEKEVIMEANLRGLAEFSALPLAERIERLKQIGILNEQGELAEEYGGAQQDVGLED
jgi:hypothetical protein